MAKEARKGAPICGLYIRINPGFVFEDVVKTMRDVFLVTTRSAYERNMYVLELPQPSDTKSEEEISGLIEFAQQHGFVAILRSEAALAKQLFADGVLLERVEDIPAARNCMGDEAIVGLRCGLSRSVAEQAGGLKVDYVSFACTDNKSLVPLDIVSWWATRSEAPCLVEGNVTNDSCGAYVQAGAGFIESDRFIFDHAQGPRQATVDMLYAIGLAADASKAH